MKDVNWTYCGAHFTVYTNIKSPSCIPETNVMLYVSYTSIKEMGGGAYHKNVFLVFICILENNETEQVFFLAQSNLFFCKLTIL